MAEIIDGKAYAAGLRAHIAAQVAALGEGHGLTPGLAVVLVGDVDFEAAAGVAGAIIPVPEPGPA